MNIYYIFNIFINKKLPKMPLHWQGILANWKIVVDYRFSKSLTRCSNTRINSLSFAASLLNSL